MQVFIPTHLRYNRQITWNNLPVLVREWTRLVVANGEGSKYDPNLPVVETPPEVRGIGATRQWVLENATEDHIVMLDDDLTFAVRRTDVPSLFNPATADDVTRLFSSLDGHLDRYAHATVLAREFGNNNVTLLSECGRAMRILAFNVAVLRKENVRFNPELVQDDFDITLQLLKKGYPNLIIGWMVQNQSGSGAAGGASAYRSMEAHNASVQKLAALHPGFVSVVEKKTKVAWGGQPRLDVVCQWKKAFQSSKRYDTGSKSES